MYHWKRIITIILLAASTAMISAGCDSTNKLNEAATTADCNHAVDQSVTTPTNMPTVTPIENPFAILGNIPLTKPTYQPDPPDYGFDIVDGELIHYDGNRTEVRIPDTVTKIGYYAFYGNETITSVTIPASVTQIEKESFYRCTNLADISISSTLVTIGFRAFSETKWMKERQQEDLIILNHMIIDGRACQGIVKIPEGITSIADEAFSYNDAITEVIIPNTVTYIGNCSFYGCENLKKISISESVTSIGELAFSGTKWMKDKRRNNPFVIINHILVDGVTCKGEVTIPKQVNRINEYAFCEWKHDHSDLSEFESSSMTKLTIPDSVTSIGASAFEDCSYLISVSMPNTIKKIENDTFSNCESLNSINLPKSLVDIGAHAFDYCISLKKINIPASIESIGAAAFINCHSLNDINLPNKSIEIEIAAFDDTLWLKKKTKENPLVIHHGALIDGKACSGDVIIPDGVTCICGGAFSGSNLTSITLPDSITDIGTNVFFNCASLTSINLPNSITSIGAYAFYDCIFLTNITLPDSLIRIGESAFEGCDRLESIILPPKITRIVYTFDRCRRLKYITIPNSVVYIDTFKDCYKVTILCDDASTAYKYAIKKGIKTLRR